MAELRNIAHNIMPASLSKLGLEAALKSLFDRISSYLALRITFTMHGLEGRLKENAEISIYRIILETVNNVVRHAEASEMTVQLIEYPE